MADLLDPDLLAAIDSYGGEGLDRSAWRVTWATRDPMAGSSGGGRWSPDSRFEVLYTSLEASGALAEAYYHLSKAPVMSSSHMRLNHLHITLSNVLVLNKAQIKTLGVDDLRAPESDPNFQRSRAIGEAAFMLDYQGLMVPSARSDAKNLVVFVERIDPDADITLLGASEVNWPAWKEQQ